jgi:hypothetical protein
LINVMNRLPGVNIQTVGITRLGANIRGQIAEVERAIREGVTDIQDVALAPLAGDALRRAFSAAQEAGQLAAEAAVAGRRANNIAGEAAESTAASAGRATKAISTQVDTVQRQIDALFRQAATFKMSATEAKLSLDDSFGLAAQAGVDIPLSDNWAINLAVWYIDIDSTAKIRTDVGTVEFDVSIDPWVYNVGIAYRF